MERQEQWEAWEHIKVERLEGESCRSLRPLWEEVFHEDSREFTDYYFQEKAAENEGYVLMNKKEPAAMLYLSPYPLMIRRGEGFDCQQINYIVGVATKERCRHRGYMDRLLKTALQDMYEKAQPFTFLMPANPRIYRPYQFSYIYDRMEYKIGNGNENGNEKTCLRQVMKTAKEADMLPLAEFAQDYLKRQYDVFIRREESYYRTMEKELRAQNGGIFLLEEKGKIKGYVLYTEEEKGEIQEAVFDGNSSGGRVPVVAAGVKTPIIMARIVNTGAMLSLLRTKSGRTALRIRVEDPLLGGNNGIWNCTFSEKGADVWKEETEAGNGAELVAASKEKTYGVKASIDALVSWVFGYRDAAECFCFDGGTDGAEREKMLRHLRNIRLLKNVFLNEIV